MDDSWSRFWEQLFSDWVAVVLVAFTVQGLWFGLVSVIADGSPGAAEGLGRVSGVLFEFPKLAEGQGLPWLLGTLGGLGWGVKRALAARERASDRR